MNKFIFIGVIIFIMGITLSYLNRNTRCSCPGSAYLEYKIIFLDFKKSTRFTEMSCDLLGCAPVRIPVYIDVFSISLGTITYGFMTKIKRNRIKKKVKPQSN